MSHDTTRPPFADADDTAPGADAGGDRSGLPEHEFDDATVGGGGIMSQGGTAVDRGTGDLGPGARRDADEPVLDGGLAAPTAAGQATPYVVADPDDADRERLTDQNDLLLAEHDRDPDDE